MIGQQKLSEGVIRPAIEDNINQVDFVLGDNVTVCGDSGYYSTMTNVDFVVKYSIIQERPRPIPRAILDTKKFGRSLVMVPNHSSVDSAIRKLIPAHLQYLESALLGHERKLASEIRVLDCYQDNSRLHELYLLSQFMGIRAAAAVGYPKRFLLNSFGEQGFISRCTNLTADFSAILTKCGYQPSTGNFTIAKDGMSLYPFSPCYWQNGMVRFGEVIF